MSEPARSPAARGIDRPFVEELGNGIMLEMAAIPGGEFAMGAPASEPDSNSGERPRHRVRVQGFHMGRCAVTVAQWTAVMADVPDAMQRLDGKFAADERQPVVRVSWNDADAFCARLSARSGRPYRLPAEAEWEYACRAGTTTPYWFGTELTADVANFETARRGVTLPVGSLGAANPFGLLDMHGNVWEWCQDRWNSTYEGAPVDGSAWNVGADPRTRVLRGGSWASRAAFCRAAARSFAGEPTVRSRQIGFRVAMSSAL